MNTHITRTVTCCFAVLRQTRSSSRSVSQPVVQSLIVSLVISRLDYGSATLAGLPACQLDILQSVLNAAARLIQEIWTLNAAAARTSLVVNPGTNHVSAGRGYGVPLSEWTCTTVHCWWPSPGGGSRVTATAVFSGDFDTDRRSHGTFYDRRSRFLCRSRSGVEQPSSALGDVISVPSGFPKTSLDSSM